MISPESLVRRPVIASTSSVWPLPWTPAMATISPARTSRSTPVDRHLQPVVADLEVPDAEDDLAGLGGALRDDQLDVAPDHQVGQLLARGRLRVGACPATRPRRRTTMLSATSRTSLSLWVMKMTVVPVAVSDRMIVEQLLGLVRRQHGARLVEDEDVAVAVERLQDLDALAHADRQALDLGVRVDVQLVLLGQLDDPPPGGRAIERAQRTR